MEIAIVAKVLVDPLETSAAAGDGGTGRGLDHEEHGLEAAAGLAAGVQAFVVAAAKVVAKAPPQAVPASVEVPADAPPAEIGEGQRAEEMPPLGDSSRGLCGSDRIGVVGGGG